jgi:hypothetical protein
MREGCLHSPPFARAPHSTRVLTARGAGRHRSDASCLHARAHLLSPPSPVVCRVPLGIRQSGLFLKNVPGFGAFGPDFDGIELLGDEFRDATGGRG